MVQVTCLQTVTHARSNHFDGTRSESNPRFLTSLFVARCRVCSCRFCWFVCRFVHSIYSSTDTPIVMLLGTTNRSNLTDESTGARLALSQSLNSASYPLTLAQLCANSGRLIVARHSRECSGVREIMWGFMLLPGCLLYTSPSPRD